eukprot:scpid95434/ scgid5824/ Sushi, von Willebrand factor type A, EGF and pentraxin domain-containing protein 1; CCP module-containing protein 22; Polydom; Selectin-like osteoblast-derived protein; Serologically defined breast cancer antigen NY-BR-38
MKFDICPNVTLSSTRWNIASERSTDAKGVVAEERFPVLLFQRTLPNLLVTCAERLRRALIQKVNKTSWIEYITMLPVALLVVLITTWMSVPASAATCPPIPHLPNGYYTTSVSSFTNGGIATANCFPGYQANRPNFIKCGSDGTWPMGASSLPTCTSTTCSAAPTIANGYLTFNSGSFMDGGLATVSCFPGYNLTGSATISCRGGQWPSGAFRPTCTQITCSDSLAVPAHGQLANGSNMLSSVRLFSCMDGYELSGLSYTTCLSNGSWSSANPVCNRVLCSSQVAPSNGAIASMSLEINGATIFTCNSGYNLVGSSASV